MESTSTYQCATCGFNSEDIQVMDQHLTTTGHSLHLGESTMEIGSGGKTVTEATGIPDGLLGSGRGKSDPLTGVSDYGDNAGQSDREAI